MSDYETFEQAVASYSGGADLMLRISARDGHIVIGLAPSDNVDRRACRLEPDMAEKVIAAIQRAVDAARR